MQLIKALFFLLIFSFSTVQAQDTFERLYTDSEYDYIGLDVASTADGSFYIYSAVKHKDSSYYSRVNLTLLSKKGDYKDGKSWDYFVGDSLSVADSLAIFPEGSMSLMKDHIIMSFTTIEEGKPSHVFFKANLSGDVIWKQVTGGNTVAEVTSERNIIEYNNSNERLLHLGSIDDGEKNGFYINQYTDSGSQDRGNTYNHPTEDFVEQIGGIEPTLHDSAYIFCGMNDVINSDLFVSKLDSNGLVLWAKTYALNENSSFTGNAVDIIQMNDTSYIVAYNQVDSDDRLKGYISRLDSVGNHVWTKALSYDTTNCEISELLNTKNGHFTIAMKKMQADTHGIIVLASFDLDANLQWEYAYKEAYNIDGIDGGMVKTSNQKIAYLMTGYDSMATTFTPLRYLIQADLTGVTRCNEVASDLIIDSTGVFQDDFTWEIGEMETPTDKELREDSRIASQFRVKRGETKSCYCKMDNIDVLLDADTKGAVSFLWNDMSMLDTFRIDTIGEYSVKVMIEDQYCYSVCDTVTLKMCDEPSVSINANAESYCVDGMVTLFVDADAPAGIASYSWSPGGATTPQITVPLEGIISYSVTIIDNCEISATASITLDEADFIPTISLIATDSGCDKIISITNIDSIVNTSIVWTLDNEDLGKNGEIFITTRTAGVYSVTAQDICGNTVTASLNVTIEEQDIELKTELSCETGTVKCYLAKNNYNTILWSTGETTDTIFVAPGSYTVTADVCDIEKTQQFTVSLDDCPDPFTFPNAFIPAQVEDEFSVNKRFGPVSNIDDVSIEDIEVDNYKLLIFNRWGQLVFESNELNNMWDGTYENENAIGGTYFFRASYTYLTREISVKGGLELIR